MARAFNAITNSNATQLQPTSQMPSHKSCDPLMKNSNTQPRKKTRSTLLPRTHLEPGKKELAKTMQQTVWGRSRPVKREEGMIIWSYQQNVDRFQRMGKVVQS